MKQFRPDEPAASGHVLLIDDGSAIRLALSRWFVRRGWTVTQCEDGAQALVLRLLVPQPDRRAGSALPAVGLV